MKSIKLFSFDRNRVLVGYEVLTAVVIKNYIFWDITPCSLLKVNRCFGGTCRLHLQRRKISQPRNQHEASSKQNWFLTWFIFDPEYGDTFLRNVD
jgi:hypothetical protein